MPDFRARPVSAPANDNQRPTRARGLRVPGVVRRLPVFLVGFTVLDIVRQLIPTGETWGLPGYEQTLVCFAGGGTVVGAHNVNCGQSFTVPPLSESGLRNVGYTIHGPQTGVFPWRRIETWTVVSPPSTATLADVQALPSPTYSVSQKLLPSPLPGFYPGYYPPLLQPPAGAAPPLRPGLYKGPVQIMPEWPDSGYSAPGQPASVSGPRWLRSRRPPPRERERKVRAKDYAVGRTIEWLVSQSTEGLDFQRALFEALPWWRKIQLYNAARQLETRYADGRIVAGRLHYRDLTPIEKAQAIYDYIDEIDTAKAVENAVKMQLTDMFWAEIGQRMGRYQTGPWDDHGFDGPPKPEPEWEWYIPDIAPDNTHNHWTYETLVNKRLTQQEAQRIHTQFDQFRSAPYQERKFR